MHKGKGLVGWVGSGNNLYSLRGARGANGPQGNVEQGCLGLELGIREYQQEGPW